VRVWSCYATIPDSIPHDLRLKKTVGRLATYLQGYGDLMVSTNGWDPAVLERFRASEVVRGVPGAIDQVADTATLEQIAELLPDEWLEPAAYGTAEQCAERVLRQMTDLGCDGVIMHGATPDQLAPVVEAYRGVRPSGTFDHLAANPGA
jgi:5,10-methylenetetrahydromethanopterin reductase